MSQRTKQSVAASRRTRRAEQPAAVEEFGFVESQRVVSNPIFYCGGNGSPSQPKPRGDQLRCVYGTEAIRKLVHDPSAAGNGIGKPLPLPPCRAHHGARVGPAVVVGGPHGRLLWRIRNQDPFLAAYVACSKSSNGENVKRHREEKTTRRRWRKGEKGDIVRGCGIWNGWAAGARYAGAAVSCKSGCSVVNVYARDAPAAAAKEEAEAEAPAGPMLDLSWAPVVLSARALERRRERR